MDDVGWTLTLLELFIQHRPTYFRSHDQKDTIVSYLVLKSNIVGWRWICLNTPASNTVQHHLTMLDNVWATCLIRLNGPLEATLLRWRPPADKCQSFSAYQISTHWLTAWTKVTWPSPSPARASTAAMFTTSANLEPTEALSSLLSNNSLVPSGTIALRRVWHVSTPMRLETKINF